MRLLVELNLNDRARIRRNQYALGQTDRQRGGGGGDCDFTCLCIINIYISFLISRTYILNSEEIISLNYRAVCIILITTNADLLLSHLRVEKILRKFSWVGRSSSSVMSR